MDHTCSNGGGGGGATFVTSEFAWLFVKDRPGFVRK